MPDVGVVSPTAERRVTSVLFGDLVGFTALSESRDPEEVRDLLSRYFDAAREIVTRYGGLIEKFIGDAVMAVWGVPTSHEDDAERAVRAGLDLVESVASFGESVGAPGLAMRVGVVTGQVAVTVGATQQGMVAGDAVNTASRVQAKADPGSVWVDEQTRSLAGSVFDFIDVGAHQLKGKAEPLQLFGVRAVMRALEGDLSSDRVQAPLVGRHREAAALRDLLHLTGEERRPRLVIVSGAAGVGKTRLGWELRKYIDGLPQLLLWHWGRCLSYGDGVAFSALSTAVRSRIAVAEDDDEAAVRAGLDVALQHYVPDAGDRTWLGPRLAALLDSDTTAFGRQELFGAWLMWFERLSLTDGKQLVWVIDDAQYADDGLLDFVEHLATAARVPLLLVVLARPELLARRPGLALVHGANLVGLETLSATDTGALLDLLVEGLPADVRDELVARAEGNPLFAIETVRSLYDQHLAVDGPVRTPGALRLAEGVDAARLRAMTAPASLQVLVASRLDLLTSAQRSVLATASVLGQTFTMKGLAALTERAGLGGEAELVVTLRELIARDLLTTITDRLAADTGQYAFVQAVVRAVAYQTQSRRDRCEAHLGVVEYLQSLAETDGEVGAVIAQHLHDALGLTSIDDPRRVQLQARLVDWIERSARRAAGLGAPAQALAAYQQAIEITTDPIALIGLRLAAADCALTLADVELVVGLAGDIADGTMTGATREDRARAVATVSRMVRETERRAQGWALLQPFLAGGAMDELSARTALRLARELANYLGDSGDVGERVWAERALVYAEQSADPAEIALALNCLYVAESGLGHERVAAGIMEMMIDLGRTHRLGTPLALALTNKAELYCPRDLEVSLACSSEALELAQSHGNSAVASSARKHAGAALTIMGHWDRAAELGVLAPAVGRRYLHSDAIVLACTAAIARARAQDVDVEPFRQALGSVDDGLADTEAGVWGRLLQHLNARLTGDLSAATQHALVAAELSVRLNGMEVDTPLVLPWAVDAMVDSGQFDRARALLSYVDSTDDWLVPPLLAGQALRLHGSIEAADPATSADPADIERDLLAGIEALDRLGAAPDRARAQAVLGCYLTRLGRSADAVDHLTAARATFTDLAATGWLHELELSIPDPVTPGRYRAPEQRAESS
ncbi:adenylate/guanylate cyclase domain-containing protein [Leekyejoonella antrihumi]|uniref:adenylate/guanylate cyclase domain-containing protein n=1 Tax=Leekyejoonella antrihumi TaxID=1660198 RepID=UPI001FEC3351|nr:adenylate/guanylate cyclase domain-containing protein [Leekyejoonella antrihumi]